MKRQEELVVFWFRRDLRLKDNSGLYHALKSGYKVLPVFVFDKDILNQFEHPFNAQVHFIHETLSKLRKELQTFGSSVLVDYSTPEEFFTKLINTYNIKAVYTNEDYELSAIERDKRVQSILAEKGIGFFPFKDQVIFSKDEVVKDNGQPYTVFTPYSRKWLAALSDFHLQSYNNKSYFSNFYKFSPDFYPSLSDLGFVHTNIVFPAIDCDKEIVRNYHLYRDYPAIAGTTHLGLHLRFGTISIRQLVRETKELNATYLNELIWREFYQMITWHFPHICKGHSFKRDYDNIDWRNDLSEFQAWCEGLTGYPIVDAGMRELNSTGYMHNRVRMIAASFLVKHLLIDWRWGETYFANKLLDFDFAANNGGWQWSASSGCDAAPYFRIFNPLLQTEKFDPQHEYIKKWLPEVNTAAYVKPIVDHKFARERVLAVYAKALGKDKQ